MAEDGPELAGTAPWQNRGNQLGIRQPANEQRRDSPHTHFGVLPAPPTPGWIHTGWASCRGLTVAPWA
jgi:hypothetical protein